VAPGKKEKLSEAEMLAKKAEAAQKRKLQVEKATKESEVGEIFAYLLVLWEQVQFPFLGVLKSFFLCRLKL
jgi:hypothetical protein